ncbi:MAG TPA: N-acetylmuramoyl-L-alanine amidase family protein, partial [Limnochordia bacterium]
MAIQVHVDGRPVELSSGLESEEASLLVPVELVSYLGGVADWLDDGRLRLTFGDTVLFLQPGESQALWNGQPVDLRPAPKRTPDGVLVPLGLLTDVLSLRVAFDIGRRTLSILHAGDRPARAPQAPARPAAPPASPDRPSPALVAVPKGAGTKQDVPEVLAIRVYDYGGRARVDIETSLAVEATSTLLSDPPRAVVDLPHAYLAEPLRLETPDLPAVEAVRVARFDADTVRAVVELRAPLGYQLEPRPDGKGWSLWVNRPVRAVRFDPETSQLQIEGPLHFEPQIQTLHDPERLVLDVPDATLLTGAQSFSFPTGPVAALRTSQFTPQSARIVLDLRRPALLEPASQSAPLAFSVREVLQGIGYDLTRGAIVLEAAVPFEAHVRTEGDPSRVVIDVPELGLAGPLADLTFVDGPLRRLAASAGESGVEIVAELRRPLLPEQVPLADGRTLRVRLVPSPLEGFFTIVDPGHGGSDVGAYWRLIEEKAVNLDISLRLAELLGAAGGKVELTRAADTDLFLADRPTISNELLPDIFVSIHSNSAPTPAARGTETYYAPVPDVPELSRAERASLVAQSRALANAVHGALVEAIGLPDRGVRTAPFLVLRHSRVPSVLVEVGFL